jgi:hypothetical protein
MNKTIKDFFSVLYPFFPFWAWAFHLLGPKPISFYLNPFLIPLALYLLANSKRRIPRYLTFFILFTVYHLFSSFINNTIPPGTNKIFFILFDSNVFACTLLILAVHTDFDGVFISNMNKRIFLIVVISLIVSVVQIKDPSFFFNPLARGDETMGADEEIRNSSIYSWDTSNSVGITFPILISILLNFYDTRKAGFFITLLSGIVVSFLTRARYVMLSVIIVIGQLFFSKIKSFSKKLILAGSFVALILLLLFVAKQTGFDIEKIISSRILEKDSEMESAKARIISYEVFIKKFPENPVFGVGPLTRPDVIDLLGGGIPIIHVGYLSYLYFYGLVGCFFLFVSLFYLLRDTWQVGRRYKFWGSFYGILAFCIANTTFVYFNFAEMGIVLAVIYARYYNTAYTEEQDTEDAEVVVPR